MGHQRDISWTRPRPEHFHVLMLCTRHYKHTVRCTTDTFTQTSWTRIPYIGEWAIVLTFLGPDHILKERIDGALDYDQQGAMLILSDRPAGPISNISVHGPSS